MQSLKVANANYGIEGSTCSGCTGKQP